MAPAMALQIRMMQQTFAADFAKAAARPSGEHADLSSLLHDVNEVQHVKHAAVGKAGK